MYDHHLHFDALHSLILERNADLTVAFNYKWGLDIRGLQSSFEHFVNMMQRQVDGRGWSSMPVGDRPTAIGLIENPLTKPHIQASFFAPQRYVDFMVSPAAEIFWRSCHRKCRKLNSKAHKDARRWTAYQLEKSSGVDGQTKFVVYLPEVLQREHAPTIDRLPDVPSKLVSFRPRSLVDASCKLFGMS